MGVVKTHVQYNSLHTIGNNLYQIAEMEIKRVLKIIFEKEIPDLNNNGYWRGKRYNLLVDEFNKVIPDCQAIIDLVGIQIPNSIYGIAENYAKSDTDFQAREKNVINDVSITTIPKGPEIGLDFNNSKVEEIRMTIVDQFKQILSSLDTYETTYSRKDWAGSAEESFTAMLGKKKAQIAGAFDNLSKQFSTLMQQTIEDMNNTENANTVGGGAGGANETHVQYEQLHKIGTDLYQIAETEVRSVLRSIYEIDIPGLNTAAIWRGKRYNLLVEEFNKLIPQCQEAIQLVGVQIPSSIYGIANNYADFDQGEVKPADSIIEDISLPEIAKGEEEALDFDSARVEETKNNIVKKFAQVVVGIGTYEEAYNKKQWEGNAEQAFTEMIKKTKENLYNMFDNLSNQFSTLMEQTQQDMAGTEQANTVGGGQAGAAGTTAAGVAAAAVAGATTASGSSNSSGTTKGTYSKDDFLVRKAEDEKRANQSRLDAEIKAQQDAAARANNQRAQEAYQSRLDAEIKAQQDAAATANNQRAADKASASNAARATSSNATPSNATSSNATPSDATTSNETQSSKIINDGTYGEQTMRQQAEREQNMRLEGQSGTYDPDANIKAQADKYKKK